jgi:hypothetical protein
VRVYVIVDLRSSRDHPFGETVETFVRREDAQRFIDEVRDDDPTLRAAYGSRSANWRRAG